MRIKLSTVMFVSGMGVLGIAQLGLAHKVTGTNPESCSPHDAGGSQSGSSFSGCYQVGKNCFARAFSCSQGSACAYDLCGYDSPYSVSGSSSSCGTSSHGGKGGHSPSIGSYSCN